MRQAVEAWVSVGLQSDLIPFGVAPNSHFRLFLAGLDVPEPARQGDERARESEARALTHRPSCLDRAPSMPSPTIRKDHMKTDSQLQQDVTAELKWEPSVHAARIGVEVQDGVVTLSGQVDSYAEKWSAERAAQRVSGVNAMAVELKVELTGLSKRTDADIGRAVENVLEWTSSLPPGAVKVMVEGGWVTLTGNVDWKYQKQTAADSVRNLMGVTGVSDQIAVRPPVSSIAVMSDIESALTRAAIADAGKISVAVHGCDVTLSGTVHNWAERETATNSAWGTPGVRNVVDMMTLAR